MISSAYIYQRLKEAGYCYHSVNFITLSLTQSDHIKPPILHYLKFKEVKQRIFFYILAVVLLELLQFMA